MWGNKNQNEHFLMFTFTIILCNSDRINAIEDQNKNKTKQTSWLLVRKRTIPTGEVVEGAAWSVQRVPTAVNLNFVERSHYFFIQVTPHCYHKAEWIPFQNH
jgi:hypothetical protein